MKVFAGYHRYGYRNDGHHGHRPYGYLGNRHYGYRNGHFWTSLRTSLRGALRWFVSPFFLPSCVLCCAFEDIILNCENLSIKINETGTW